MLSVTMLLLVALVVVAQRVEEEIPMCSYKNHIEVRHQLECPARAVCGDWWRTIRDLHNGMRCRNSSIVINCVCPNNTLCPVQNENQVFYENKEHLQFLCEPKCNLEMCSSYSTAAKETVENSPAFGRNNYDKINCRCPGHNERMATELGVWQSSTTLDQIHFNNTIGVTSKWYKCSGVGPLPGVDTVCGGSRARRGRLGLLEEEDS